MSDRIEIDFDGQLRGKLAKRLATEAERRGVEPAALLADIVEAVIKDDLFVAILDQ